MSKKFDRNIAVLNSYPEDEKDGLFYFGLGSEYLKVHDTLNAKNFFIKAISSPENNQSFRSYAAVSLAKACFDLKEYNTALNYVDMFINELPDFRDLYFLRCVYNHEIGKYSKSYIALNIFNSLPTNTQKHPSFNFENTNDIKGLLAGLLSLKVNHQSNLLTTVITIKSSNSNFDKVVRSINEISDNVTVNIMRGSVL